MSSQVRTILASELQQLANDLESQAGGLAEGSEGAAAHCLGLCERLGQVAGLIEAPALEDMAMFLISNIPGLIGDVARARHPAQLCTDLQLCLLEGESSPRWANFAARLADTCWPSAMEADAADELLRGLQPLAVDEPEPAAQTAPRLSAEDLTLRPPDDVGAETLQAFFHEGPLKAAQLNQLLGTFGDATAEAQIAAAQRLAHTLKGSSALCGLHAIAHLAHALEAALQRVAALNRISPQTRNRLIEAGDMIEQLIELAADGATVPETLPALITALYADPEENATEPAVQPAPASESAEARSIRSGEEVQAQEAPAAIVPTLNVPTAVIDENLRRAGEVNVAVAQLNAHVAGVLERANRLAQQLTVVQARVYELETLVDTRGVPAVRAQRGSGEDFDPLELDEYTALHSLSRAFAESTLDSRELSRELSDEVQKLQALLRQHARLGRELTDSVMNARMVPVTTIVSRLERIVRQTARQTGREVELEILGRDLSIDTDILTGLVEPLMHALRNAVDHGIETPEQRRALGKPGVGRIRLQFRREGNRIEVTCEDDGRGLDYAAIEGRARERGLLAPGQQASTSQLASLIFLQGFSTREEVSAVSGRGVGMDVVRVSIERLKGSAHIESRDGAGCTLTFRLPLSLTAAHALFVVVDGAVFGLPSTTVDQVLYSDTGRVLQLGDQHAFEYRRQILPLHSLATLLERPGQALEELQTHPRPLVIVNTDEGQAALSVDRVVDSRQIVIKGLSSLLPTLPGVAGACVLPDGSIAVVLEVRDLLRQPVASPALNAPIRVAGDARRAHQVLVVDDSLSARRALSQLLADSGYEVATAFDGLDAIARIDERMPDVVLVDLEMPRMNGLELTSHLRGRPDMRSLPIVMITSRGAEKHRAQALRAGVTEYLTKPYLEHELLDRLHELISP